MNVFSRESGRVSCDVVVIGTGAGGAAAACALALGGRDVVMLEAGAHHTAADMTQREDEMLPRLFAEEGRRATSDAAIPILQGRCVGGSTTHNTGYVYRAPQGIVERWRREAGFAPSDARLDRLYGDLERAIAVTPCREEDVNANNAAVLRGARALGWRARRTNHNRAPSCSGCGYCVLGCAYNRKQGGLVTFVPAALARGARLLAHTSARRIEAGGRAGYRVVCDATSEGRRPRREVLEARRIVVACGAIDSPLLLARSGLARRSPLGTRLRIHPGAPVGALFDEPVVAWRGVPQAVMVEEFATYFETGRGGYLLMPANATPALQTLLLPGVGAAHRDLVRAMPRFASGSVLLHDETCGSVRARLTDSMRPDIRYWPDAADIRELTLGIRNLARLYLAAGARRVLLPFRDAPPVESEGALDAALARGRPLPHLLALSSVHPQSTCPIGRTEEEGVVRPDLRLHDEDGRGIWVADTSVYPSSIGAPPQLTAMLMGALAAESILEAGAS